MSSISNAASVSAGHRRLAYQCLRCLHRYDVVKIDAKYRIHDHFMVKHVPLDEVPYYCRLCQFRARRREELDNHVTRYPRHLATLKEKGLSHQEEMLVACPHPYVITERDVVPLSAKDSQRHWEEKSRKRPDLMQIAVDATLGDDFGQNASTVPLLNEVQVPTTPGGIEVSKILQPLQQLVSIFGGIPVVGTGAQHDPAHTEEPRRQETTLQSQPPVSAVMAPTALLQPKPAQEACTPSTHKPALPVATKTSIITSPAPSVAETAGVLAGMPTIEECRALTTCPSPASSSSSSGSSSSTSSTCQHHEQILKEIRELRDTVGGLQDHFIRQYGNIQDLATKLLSMAGQLIYHPTTSQPQTTEKQAPSTESSEPKRQRTEAVPIYRPTPRSDRRDRLTPRRENERRHRPDHQRSDRRRVVHHRR